jgi:hypothetical protein
MRRRTTGLIVPAASSAPSRISADIGTTPEQARAPRATEI